MTQVSHSYSSLKMYENCPKRYYHQRITKEVSDSGSEATRYGERVHKALEDRLTGDSKLTDEFALQVFSHFPHINRVTTSFVWLKDMKQDRRSFCRDLSGEMQGHLNGRVARINQSLANDDFPAKPSGLCRWCPCYEWCEYAS